MILLSRIAKNTGAVLLGTLVRMGASFVLVLLIARYLGSEGMGEYTVILSLYWIVQKIATMGLEPIIIREVAKNESSAQDFLSSGIVIGILTSVVMSSVMIMFAHLANYDHVIITSIYIVGPAVLFATVSLIFQAVFIAFEKAELSLYGNVINGVSKLLLAFAAMEAGYGLVTVMAAFTVSTFLGLIVNALLANAFILKIRFSFSRSVFLWTLKTMPVFAGTQIVHAFSGNITAIIMSLLMSMELVGYYGAAMQLVGAVRMVIQSYKIAIQPVTAKTFEDSLRELRKFCIKSMKYICMLTIPLSVGTTMLAAKIIALFYPPEFFISALLLQVLIWVIPLYGLSMVLTSVLIASNNQKLVFTTLLISLSVRIGLAFTLIPLISYRGAAAAVLVSEVVNFIVKTRFVFKRLFRVPYAHFTWKIAISTTVMAAVILVLGNLPVLLTAAAASIVFAVMQTLLGELPAVRHAVCRVFSVSK